MNANYREGSRKNCRSIFLSLFAQNVSILGNSELKADTFFAAKRLKPLSVNVFIVNHQVLINANS
ncbi:MAG: hypothetical protein F6K18_09790 [Okeania sp. SIO2C2]|uniref:hypothetical protein n=1 Tax=Okeania sp. SIO2C2 TaxID=2607787 RepID=UPI0013B953CF|nr:hypothetical protein [Okeania sp. SIO2C2]NEP87098.1 hypothetical protein [Okeania sp. SIO2C2]